jgi:hypothetical protein
MGRIATRGTGATGGGSSAVPNTNTTLNTGEAVLPNDILTIGADDGKAYWALNPDHPYAVHRPLSTTAAAVDVQFGSTVVLSLGSVGTNRMMSCKLTNGNLAIFTLAPTTNYPTLYIVDAYGVLVTAAVTVDTVDASSAGLDICQQANGNLAMTWTDVGGVNPKHAVYSAAGAVVTAAAQIEVATGLGSICIGPLTGGGYVVAYYKTVAAIRYPHFARFNAAGALQGAVTQVDTTTTGNIARLVSFLAIACLTGGGFVIAYCSRNGSTDSTWWARYDATGVLQGAKTQLGNTTNPGTHGIHCCALTDGGFAVISWPSAANNNATHKHAKYDAAGALVAASG